MAAASSEKEKMLAGQLYVAADEQLTAERTACRALVQQYNHSLDYSDSMGKAKLLGDLLGGIVKESPPFFEPPFRCDYGYNIRCGRETYANFNCTILDCAPVNIGDRVLMGPNVSLYTAGHPIDGHVRRGLSGPEWALPITIGDDVWIGGGVTVLPGVTIGKGSVIGAAAVVTKDVEPYTVVAGSPARLLRRLDPPPAA